jgi:hypothetical protein
MYKVGDKVWVKAEITGVGGNSPYQIGLHGLQFLDNNYPVNKHQILNGIIWNGYNDEINPIANIEELIVECEKDMRENESGIGLYADQIYEESSNYKSAYENCLKILKGEE